MTVPDWIPEKACSEVRFFCDYWIRQKGAAHLPASGLIDPLDFFPHLSRIFIAEGSRLEELQIRLAGTAYRALYGFEITGSFVVDLIPFENRHDLLLDYTRCLDRQLPIYHSGTMNWRSRGTDRSYERILLPFGSDRGVEKIMGFAQFFDIDGRSLF